MNILQKMISNIFWKTKALLSNIEMKWLEKRANKLEASRDKWKAKTMENQIKFEELKKQKRLIEQELNKK